MIPEKRKGKKQKNQKEKNVKPDIGRNGIENFGVNGIEKVKGQTQQGINQDDKKGIE